MFVCMFDIVSICIWTGGDDDTTQPKVKFLMGRLLSLILSVSLRLSQFIFSSMLKLFNCCNILSVCPYVCHILFFPLHWNYLTDVIFCLCVFTFVTFFPPSTLKLFNFCILFIIVQNSFFALFIPFSIVESFN
jgi:hypothetical protein